MKNKRKIAIAIYLLGITSCSNYADPGIKIKNSTLSEVKSGCYKNIMKMVGHDNQLEYLKVIDGHTQINYPYHINYVYEYAFLNKKNNNKHIAYCDVNIDQKGKIKNYQLNMDNMYPN